MRGLRLQTEGSRRCAGAFGSQVTLDSLAFAESVPLVSLQPVQPFSTVSSSSFPSPVNVVHCQRAVLGFLLVHAPRPPSMSGYRPDAVTDKRPSAPAHISGSLYSSPDVSAWPSLQSKPPLQVLFQCFLSLKERHLRLLHLPPRQGQNTQASFQRL